MYLRRLFDHIKTTNDISAFNRNTRWMKFKLVLAANRKMSRNIYGVFENVASPPNLPDDVVDSLPVGLNTGIYYGWASLNGQIYKMVASIGWNPFYKNEKKSLEVHILHKFVNDFYGEQLKVIITGYIRPEKNFSSVEALIEAIQNDIAMAEQQLDEPRMSCFRNDTFIATQTQSDSSND